MVVGLEQTFSPQKFSIFPSEYLDDLWATKSEHVRLIVCTVSFQDFQLMWSSSTNVTDGQTDRQMICDLKTALCTMVHREVMTLKYA